ncbi:hypothetical protein EVAR_85736_1 [Eumeta japonica]|uniref:Pre-C2HC domain-containing protein n=1 Tax=Eumeta variegata TaxID=151549 RepID=A0A4C1TL03_EUMVA|nr:hypothetical protein EVAR_85736_1 [Eumeta japonica]
MKFKPTSAARASLHSVHRLCCRDGSPLLVLAVLPRTEEAKNIFNNLNMVCGLGIRVEARTRKEVQGSATAASCTATRRQLSCDPRCVKCLVPHWTRECLHRESGENPPVNCLQHTANYRMSESL